MYLHLTAKKVVWLVLAVILIEVVAVVAIRSFAILSLNIWELVTAW